MVSLVSKENRIQQHLRVLALPRAAIKEIVLLVYSEAGMRAGKGTFQV